MLRNDYKQSAERLLTMLAVFPTGTTLDSLWMRDFRDLGPCIESLLDTSLIEKRNDTHLVHPLISSYILDKSRLCADAVTVMVDTACQFLKQNQSLPGDKTFGDNNKALQGEEMNLQAILFAATCKDARLLEGLLILARHHRATRPRTEVAGYAVEMAREIQCDKKLLAEALFCCGINLAGLEHHEESRKALEQARETFLSVADGARAAQCLLEIVESQTYIKADGFEMKDRVVEQAKSEFESLSDRSGIGRSLYWSGVVHWQAMLYSRACKLLLEAETTLEDQPLYLAHCSFALSCVYFGTGDYDQGCTAGERAIAQYEQIGYGEYEVRVQHIIGIEYIAKGKYDDALVILSAALEKFKLWGGPLSIAQVWLEMGRAWIKTGQREDAQDAIQTSLDVLSTAQPSDSREYAVLRSQFYLRWLDDPQSTPSDDERKALDSFNHLSNFSLVV